MLSGGREIISSSNCCFGTLLGELRVYTLLGIQDGNGLSATLSLELSIDNDCCPPRFHTRKDVHKL